MNIIIPSLDQTEVKITNASNSDVDKAKLFIKNELVTEKSNIQMELYTPVDSASELVYIQRYHLTASRANSQNYEELVPNGGAAPVGGN